MESNLLIDLLNVRFSLFPFVEGIFAPGRRFFIRTNSADSKCRFFVFVNYIDGLEIPRGGLLDTLLNALVDYFDTHFPQLKNGCCEITVGISDDGIPFVSSLHGSHQLSMPGRSSRSRIVVSLQEYFPIDNGFLLSILGTFSSLPGLRLFGTEMAPQTVRQISRAIGEVTSLPEAPFLN